MTHIDTSRSRTPHPSRFLTRDDLQAALEYAKRVSVGGGDLSVWVSSRAVGYVRWARNSIIAAGETTDHRLFLTREIRSANGSAEINYVDEDSIRNAVKRAEASLLRESEGREGESTFRTRERYDLAKLWSDETAALNADHRATLYEQLIGPAKAARLLSAGYIEVRFGGDGYVNTKGLFAYAPVTRAEYSVTVRNEEGTGSGWAGVDNMDWRKIDGAVLSAVALEKCKTSANPVAIEPGRYTVILEPQAVADLTRPMVVSFTDREGAEQGGPWKNGAITHGQRLSQLFPHVNTGQGANSDALTKIAQRVIDKRLTISVDPMDPEMPLVPFDIMGSPVRATNWIEHGVLRSLAYRRWYGLRNLNTTDPLVNTYAFRMSGGDTPMSTMIETMKRGLLVTRLVNVRVIEDNSLLCSGTTSDGLWLIENGKITKAVKNFRFRESPLFALNNVVSIGPQARVYMKHAPAIVPSLVIRDFSMNSLIDAV